MDKGSQRFSLYCGLAFPIVFFAGFLVAGLFPLLSPHASLSEVRHFYADHPTRMRAGLFIMIASAPLQAPLAGLIGVHMRRVEGEYSVLAYTEMLLGGVAVLAVLIPTMDFVNVAYRPETRDVHTLQAFSDQAWLIFVGMWSAATMQNICIGIAILRDNRTRPIMPRWFGYLNIWVGTLFVPGGMIYFFDHGAFAWDGVFAFWLPASVFGGWFIAAFVVFKRVIEEQTAEPSVAPALA